MHSLQSPCGLFFSHAFAGKQKISWSTASRTPPDVFFLLNATNEFECLVWCTHHAWFVLRRGGSTFLLRDLARWVVILGITWECAIDAQPVRPRLERRSHFALLSFWRLVESPSYLLLSQLLNFFLATRSWAASKRALGLHMC